MVNYMQCLPVQVMRTTIPPNYIKHKEIICAWENTDFIMGQSEQITTIPGRGKNAHPLFD